MTSLAQNGAEDANIQVAVRVRPLNKREENSDSIIESRSKTITIKDPDTKKIKSFDYDYVYSERSTQEDLFRDIGKYVIDNACKGYNTCVFAYGQTGCFAKGTDILMYDSTEKLVEDIEIGDLIMGDDGTHRTVKKLFRGEQALYKVISKAYYLPNYIVNADHIMVLWQDNKLVEIPISELELNKRYTGVHVRNWDIMTYPIIIEYHSFGEYYGFMLDGNHRFLHPSGIVMRNSGKSHAMTGSDESPGLIPRICKSLFEKNDSLLLDDSTNNVTNSVTNSVTTSYKLEISYLEIYSEEVRDLLSQTPTRPLKVREHSKFGPYVEGLSRILVEDYATIQKLIDQGNKERVTASTLMNSRSSRSHAILTLCFTQLIHDPENAKTREIVSKINLVDLAGSERIEISGVVGINFKEAIDINKSLSTLGLVISKLANNSNAAESTRRKLAGSTVSRQTIERISSAYGTTLQGSTSNTSRTSTGGLSGVSNVNSVSGLSNASSTVGVSSVRLPKHGTLSDSKTDRSSDKPDRSISEHVPYRDSTLTWILKESLGGNSKTFMLATVSPSEYNYNESLSTLRYATNAKKIVNKVVVNEDSNDKLVKGLKDEIASLKQQLLNKSVSGSTATLDDIKLLKDEISQREELIRERDKTWEQKLEESKKINSQIQEQLRDELTRRKSEFRQKMEQMNLEREQLLKTMASMKSVASPVDVKQQKELEEEFLKKQSEFEKNRIFGTAVSLQEYYERKLEKMKEEYDKQAQEYQARENSKTIKDIVELKETNVKLKEELNKYQRDLHLQIRQFTDERSVLSKQIQQLHNKIHSLEKDHQPTNSTPIVISEESTQLLQEEYVKIAQLRSSEEKKYKTLTAECDELNSRINSNKRQLAELEEKHTNMLKEVETKTVDLVNLKTEYADLAEKFAADKLAYDDLITKKELLHTEIVTLKCNLDMQVDIAKEKLKNPTIEDLLRIKDGLAKIFESIKK